MKPVEITMLFLTCVIDQASAFVKLPPVRSSAIGQQSRSLAPYTQVRNEKLNEEAIDLQRNIEKLVADPKMFAAWNNDNFDENALPIPMFTAQLVTLASVAFTAWIYYLGFTAPSHPPMS